MAAVLYTAYALAHVWLTVLVVRQLREKPTWRLWVVLVLATTLAYDNAMIALGSAIGEGDLLLALSWPRFIIHAVATPISIAVVIDQGREAGVPWIRGWSRAMTSAWALTGAMIALGVYELFHLELVAEEGLGLLRYGSAEPSIPIPAVLAVIAMIAVGWSIRRMTQWSTLFVLGVVSFVGSAVPPIEGLLIVGNLVEIAFVAGLLQAEQFVSRIERREVVATPPNDPPAAVPAR